MRQRKILLTVFTILSIVGYGAFVFAATGPFAPGAELNPGCSYTDPNCTVDLSLAGISIGSPVVTGTPNQVLYTDASGNVASDALFSRDIALKTTTIGEDFGGGVIGGLQVSDDLFGLGIKGSYMLYAGSDQSIGAFVGDLTSVGQRPWSAGFTYTNDSTQKLVLSVIDDTKIVQRYADEIADINAQFQLDSTGNTLTWDADTNDSIIDGIAQGNNLNGVGYKGIAVAHNDTSTLEAAAFFAGDTTATGGTPYEASMSYVKPGFAGVFSYQAFKDGLRASYRDDLANIYSQNSQESTGNTILWNADTTDTLTDSFEQGQDLYGIGLKGNGVFHRSTTGDATGLFVGDTTSIGLGPFTTYIGSATTGALTMAAAVQQSAFGAGDLLGNGNGTVFALNDATQTIAFNYDGDYYKFPIGDGDPGQVMQTDGNNQLSWVTPSGGGGSPGGNPGDIQFNNSGSFAGDGIFSYSSSTNTVSLCYHCATNSPQGTFLAPFYAIQSNTGSGQQLTLKYAGNTDLSLTLPDSNGGNGDVLSTDGSGNLSWVTPGGGGWGLTGNSGTTFGTDFIGTTDNQDLQFRVNNSIAGFVRQNGSTSFGYQAGDSITSGLENSSFGLLAGESVTSGNYNSSFGTYAGRFTDGGTANSSFGAHSGVSNVSGSNNAFFGMNAGYSSTADDNTFIGANSGLYTTTGAQNVFLGKDSGYANTTGYNNNFLGMTSGRYNTTGNNNVFNGAGAGNGNITGSYNIFEGVGAGNTSTTGANNVFIGYRSGFYNTTANYNVFLGGSSGYSNTTGAGNVFTGLNTGYYNTTGSNNTFNGFLAGMANLTGSDNLVLGASADVATGSTSNAIALGSGAIAASNQFALPDSVTLTKWRGVGYEFPSAQAAGVDYVLANDGAGTLSWLDSATIVSDSRLKSNIIDLGQDILSKLGNVRTVTYTLNSDESQKVRIGFVAQDLEQTFPELVTTRDDGYKAVYYAQMTPVLVEAIRELNLKITDIENFAHAENKTFLNNLIAWLGDVGNGIGDLFATSIHSRETTTELLCVGTEDNKTCLNKDQIDQVLHQGISNSFGYGYGGN